MLKGPEICHTCSPKNILPKAHSLNVNYVKKFIPRYARAFSPPFLNLNIILTLIIFYSYSSSRYKIVVCHIPNIIPRDN